MNWDEYQKLCNVPAVDEALRALMGDNTNDNAVCVVRAIIENMPPIPMIIFCPACGHQHIDKEDEIECAYPECRDRCGFEETGCAARLHSWTNPPHRSHECQHCKLVWRPSDFPTTGVERIETKGKRDVTAPYVPGNAHSVAFYAHTINLYNIIHGLRNAVMEMRWVWPRRRLVRMIDDAMEDAAGRLEGRQ